MEKLARNKYAALGGGVAITLILGAIDYETGIELSFAIFYLLPITLVTWYAGRNCGLAISLLSTALWMNADMSEVTRYVNEAAPYWNALVRFGLFSIIVFLLSSLRSLSLNLEKKVRTRTAELTSEINERKKTEDELHRKSEKLRLLAKRIQSIKEEENTKIAREIHDELGQALTAIKIATISLSKKHSNDEELVKRSIEIVDIVDDTIKSIRRISSKLRPRLLDELGLLPAIEWQLKDFRERTGVEYNLTADVKDMKLNPTISTAAFRIFQEAVTNIARHSHATQVDVGVLFNSEGSLKLTIKDNGSGFRNGNTDESGSGGTDPHGLGILGMMERAQILGGTVEFRQPEDGGTEVRASIPVKKTNGR